MAAWQIGGVEVQQFDLEDGKACNCLGVSNLLGRSAGGLGESMARWIRYEQHPGGWSEGRA